MCKTLKRLTDSVAGSIVFTEQVKVCLPSLPAWWYHITQEVKGEAKGYNCETWNWSQHLRASNSPFPTVSVFFILVTQPAALIALELKTSHLMSPFCLSKDEIKRIYLFFFPLHWRRTTAQKTKVRLSTICRAYHKSDLTDIFFFWEEWVSTHSLQGPWHLYGQCDLSPQPLRLGVRHRKLRSCSGP